MARPLEWLKNHEGPTFDQQSSGRPQARSWRRTPHAEQYAKPGRRQSPGQQAARRSAAQLLEKYKSLARDSQLAGDRVQTEYYLQFADHYHRVLSENRSRYEENAPRRQQNEFDEDEGDEDNQVEAYGNGQNEPRQERAERQDRQDRPQREYREPREQREPREYQPRQPRFEAEPQGDNENQGGYRNGGGEQPPRRDRRPRREAAEFNNELNGEAGERIALDVLPPAIGLPEATEEAAEPAPRPRRTRRPRPEANDGEEIAPAA